MKKIIYLLLLLPSFAFSQIESGLAIRTAGIDVILQMPVNYAQLTANKTSSVNGKPLSQLWKKELGPAAGTITSTTGSITGMTTGTYLFSVTLKEIGGTATRVDSVRIIVQPAPPATGLEFRLMSITGQSSVFVLQPDGTLKLK
jgi:hypothetical protein